jgi:outer membrane protein TolC
MTRSLALAAPLAVVAGLAGCASYHAAPLPQHVDLAARLSGLDLSIPADAGPKPDHRVDPAKPLTIDQIGLLAILNDPDLKSERGKLGVARAELLQATVLPNPSASLGYGALISGPGTASSIAASLSQDIAAIVTRGARVRSAKAHLSQVDADQLWREWQVAQKARQLAVDIVSDEREIGLTRHEHQLLLGELAEVEAAVGKGNLTVTAFAPLLTAVAAAEKSLQTLRQSRLTNWQALDALLGLVPSVRFAIAPPVFGPGGVPAILPLPRK